jgi:hypothetical protein
MLTPDEVLQRGKEIRAQFALLLIRAGQCPFRQVIGEKTLHMILRIRRGITAATKEGIKRRPIGFAEIGKGRAAPIARIRLAVPATQSSSASFETKPLPAKFPVSSW